jgi:hypothetical protein
MSNGGQLLKIIIFRCIRMSDSEFVIWACMDENNQFKEFYMADTPRSDRDIKGPPGLHLPEAQWTGTEIVRNDQIHIDSHMEVVRNRRNMLLSQSDWTMYAPLPESKKNEWEIYRQKLRDLPLNVIYPVWPDFPTPPS